MPLSSASTDSEVLAAFEDAVAFDATGSVALAQQLVQAGRMLLVRTPGKTVIDGVVVEWEIAVVERMVAKAEQWLASNDRSATSTGGRPPRVFDVSGGRD